MLLFLSQVFPPLAVLCCGKPFTAILNAFLWIWPWTSAVQHAEWVVENHLQDRRFEYQTRALSRSFERSSTPRLPQPHYDDPPPDINHEPTIGMNGTTFRKRK